MSPSSILVYYIFVTSIFYCVHLSIGGINDIERLALLEIKAKISHDPLGVMTSWNDSLPFCEWYGVTCARPNEGVTTLNLSSTKLAGTISSHIGNLSFLEVVRLDHNNFWGTIAPEIGRLHRLQTLLLSHNSIGGEVPSNISNCYSLINLALDFNNLVGGIPPPIGCLSHLRLLSLSGNKFRGNIPSSIGNLSSLVNLFLDQNNFFGRIPESIGNLKNLTSLSLGENMLNGIVPTSIFNLSLLTLFSLRQNELQGDLPLELGNALSRLTFLSLDFNRFTGGIPSSISNSSNLETLQLNDNNLQGQVPSLHKLVNLVYLVLSNNSLGHDQIGDLNFLSSLSNATSLQWVEIDQNNFKGGLPQIICNFTMLTRLVIFHNNIVGEIPTCIEKLHKLQNFLANDNKLSGNLPQSIGMLQDLYLLKLNNNQLSGFIPHSIGNLTKLSIFSLTNNRFEGQIPASLGKCTSLTELYLGNNSLNGTIPSQLFTFQRLSIIIVIHLNRNHLTGHLPEEIGRLANLRIFVVSYNMLSGKIPTSLSGCITLEYLYLSKNEFHGTIPHGLHSLKGLLELDLSYNNLIGEIPPFLASLQLVLLNVSHNILEGKVPIDGVFSNATRTIIVGNSRLCGGISELNLPRCNSNHKTQKKKVILIVSILSCVFGVVIFLVVVLVLSCKWCQRKKAMAINNKEQPMYFGHLEKFPNLSYQTLFKASEGFCPENLVGSGTYGLVYQGKLEEGGPKIAIKVFKLDYHGALRSFMVECSILRSIRHRNLVKVITSCSSVDNQGRDFKALVYEYMVNGSLEDWLHPTICSDLEIEGTCSTSKKLNFHQRLDIVVDVAVALEYLHYQCSVPIIHCDIKPSNVLLDDEMVAHVSDFGISKILFEGINGYHENQSISSSIGVRGTIGYTPPEYGLGKSVSTSGDVYSFGVLLLEIFTGKRPTNDFFKGGGVSLHYFVTKALPQQITTVLDHALLKDINNEGIHNKRILLKASIHILLVALSCSAEVPSQRLNMTDVATKLISIRNELVINYLY